MSQSTKRRRFDGVFGDLLILAGTSLIGYGLYQWRPWIAFVVVGGISLTIGALMVVFAPAERDSGAV